MQELSVVVEQALSDVREEVLKTKSRNGEDASIETLILFIEFITAVVPIESRHVTSIYGYGDYHAVFL